MRKLMMLGAMLAMVLVAAAPAIAQIGTQDEDDEESSSSPVTQEFSEEDVESGDVEPTVDISNTGNNANLCPTVLQSANSGNVQNEQGVVQYQDEVDDIEFEGSNITLSPEAEAECVQRIEQTAAAAPKAAPPPPPALTPAPAPAPAPTAEAGGGGGAAAVAGVKELPRTGGIGDIAPLLGISAGALLVAGGLIARRVMR